MSRKTKAQKAQAKANTRTLRQARKNLSAHKTPGEDDEYLRLNQAVIDAERRVSRVRRVAESQRSAYVHDN